MIGQKSDKILIKYEFGFLLSTLTQDHSDNENEGDDKKKGYCHPPRNSPARDPIEALGFIEEDTIIPEDQEETLDNLENQMMLRMTLMTKGGVMIRSKVVVVLHLIQMMILIRCTITGNVT